MAEKRKPYPKSPYSGLGGGIGDVVSKGGFSNSLAKLYRHLSSGPDYAAGDMLSPKVRKFQATKGLEGNPRPLSTNPNSAVRPGMNKATTRRQSTISRGAIRPMSSTAGKPKMGLSTPTPLPTMQFSMSGKVSSALSESPKTNTQLNEMSKSQPLAPPEKTSFFGKLGKALTAKPTNQPTSEYDNIMQDLRGKKRK